MGIKFVIWVGYKTIADETDEVAKKIQSDWVGVSHLLLGREQRALVLCSAVRDQKQSLLAARKDGNSEIIFSDPATQLS